MPAVKHRTFLLALVGLVVVASVSVVLAAGTLLARQGDHAQTATSLPSARQVPTTGQTREFQLEVGRMGWELAPGKTVDAYVYNGQVPGPELRVTEGDTVRVTVTNDLQEPTTVHWHGVEVPVGMDGVLGLSQAPIEPGSSFTYEFVATPAGTRWYHAHANELAQQGGGLVGALITKSTSIHRQRSSPRPTPQIPACSTDSPRRSFPNASRNMLTS